jgi:hypothetical protein
MYVLGDAFLPRPLTPLDHFDKVDASPLSPQATQDTRVLGICVLEDAGARTSLWPSFSTMDNNKQAFCLFPIFANCHISPTELAFATWQRGSLDYQQSKHFELVSFYMFSYLLVPADGAAGVALPSEREREKLAGASHMLVSIPKGCGIVVLLVQCSCVQERENWKREINGRRRPKML